MTAKPRPDQVLGQPPKQPSGRHFAGFLVFCCLLLALGWMASASAAIVEHGTGGQAHAGREFALHDRQPEAAVGSATAKHWTAAIATPTTPTTAATLVMPPRSEPAPMVSLPVPAAVWMFGSGLAALGLARGRISAWRRRDRRRATGNMRTSPRPARPRAVLRERLGGKAAGTLPVIAADPYANREAGVAKEGHSHSAGGGGGGDNSSVPPTPPDPMSELMARRFDELAAALVEQADVAPGRAFGMSCLKHGKRPFLVLDPGMRGGVAFRVGESSATRLSGDLHGVDLWNPKHERQAKRSWLICHDGNGEVLVRLAAEAYEHALCSAAGAASEETWPKRAMPNGPLEPCAAIGS